MKVNVKSHVLAAALDKAGRTVGGATQDNQFLESFNFQAEKDELRICSTDLEVSTLVSLTLVDVQDEGAVCIPAKMLMKVVNNAPAEDVTLEYDEEDGDVIVTSGSAKWNLRALAEKGYPEVPKIDPKKLEAVDREEFLEGLQVVRPAVSDDAARTALRMIVVRGGRMMASDGQRLHVFDGNFEKLEGLQIPCTALPDLIHLIKRVEVDDISLEQRDSTVLFRVGVDEFSTARMFADFPDVDTLMLSRTEEGENTTLQCDQEELLSSLNRVSITAPGDSKAVHMKVEEGELVLEAKDSLGNVSYDKVACVLTGDGDRDMVVNIDKLSDLVTAYDGKLIKFKLYPERKQKSAIRVDGENFTGVLMQLSF